MQTFQRNLLLAGAALGLFWWASKTQARGVINNPGALIDNNAPLDPEEILPMPETPPPVYDPNDARAREANVNAFLTAIAKFESSTDAKGYKMLYGGGTFDSFIDHPANLGWGGVQLSDAQCIAAGHSPGCVSTAAGRYQITRTTWNNLQIKLNLPDFSPQSQDLAARELIAEKDALGLVEMGKFDDAIARVRGVWASMPAAGYEQREHAIDKWRDAYASAGGSFA